MHNAYCQSKFKLVKKYKNYLGLEGLTHDVHGWSEIYNSSFIFLFFRLKFWDLLQEFYSLVLVHICIISTYNAIICFIVEKNKGGIL